MTVLEAIARQDRDALIELLADDVVFHSPVQTYRGRDRAVHLLLIMGGILQRVEVSRQVNGVTFFVGEVEEHPIDGVLDVRSDGAGRVHEITLMLRPLAALQAGVARMARALSDP
jgi:hypothetical protein